MAVDAVTGLRDRLSFSLHQHISWLNSTWNIPRCAVRLLGFNFQSHFKTASHDFRTSRAVLWSLQSGWQWRDAWCLLWPRLRRHLQCILLQATPNLGRRYKMSLTEFPYVWSLITSDMRQLRRLQVKSSGRSDVPEFPPSWISSLQDEIMLSSAFKKSSAPSWPIFIPTWVIHGLILV